MTSPWARLAVSRCSRCGDPGRRREPCSMGTPLAVPPRIPLDRDTSPHLRPTGAQSIRQIDAWLESPSVVPLSEGGTYWSVLGSLLASAKPAGPLVRDAMIAALCLSHGIRELWSTDRDF